MTTGVPPARAGCHSPALEDVLSRLRQPGWEGSCLLRRFLAENPTQSGALARALRSLPWETREDFFERQVRFGFVGAASTASLDGPLAIEGLARGIIPVSYHARTREPARELRDPVSGLHAHKPDVLVVASSAPGAIPVVGSESDYEAVVRSLIDDVEAFRARSNAVLLVHSFVPPEFKPFGLADWRETAGMAEACARLNTLLGRALREIPDAQLVDVGHLLAVSGVSWWTLHRSTFLANLLAAEPLSSCLCRDYVAFGAALRGLSKKCLVLDLDDTLWGGVVSEVGADRVQVGPDYPGNVFRSIQEVVRQLHARGVLLALNSRNFEQDAWEPFRCRPEMPLRREHFAASRINWTDKVTNLRELAAELKLGLDSFVVLDNDPVEQAWVEQHLPEVHVIAATDPLAMLHALASQRLFEGLGRSAEDALRASSSVRASKRREAADAAVDRASFLAGLNIEVTVGLAAASQLPRLAQLTQRTNQFNLTAKRYSETQMRSMCASDDTLVVYCSCADRFADEGIVGAAILRQSSTEWVVDTLLLSCRVLGWGVERALLDAVVQLLYVRGATALCGGFVPTPRNGLARDFYRDLGFTPVANEGTHFAWRLDLPASRVFTPGWIRLAIEDAS